MRPLDLIGERFGRLVVVRMVRGDGQKTRCLCRCDCGNEKEIRMSSLKIGFSQSCGCLASGRIKAANYRHGMSNSPEWICYRAMKQRCEYTKHKSYKDYGGRGITICERWRESFENFLADMGNRPDGMQLDRIDNSGNYEPTNCRWVTPKENSNNRRTRRKQAVGV